MVQLKLATRNECICRHLLGLGNGRISRRELRHRTRDASLAASNQASAGNKPTVLMKKGASSLIIIMQCARTDYYQNN